MTKLNSTGTGGGEPPRPSLKEIRMDKRGRDLQLAGVTAVWKELDHRLSVVERFGTVPKLHRQSVAEHCFNVERIAVRIAKEWFGIEDNDRLFAISRWAHHHDDLEALSGDMPSMVKPYFDEEAMAKEHNDLVDDRTAQYSQTIKNIVKLADMLDAWWFLCVENSLGNQYLNHHIEYEPKRVREFVEATWPDDAKLHKAVGDVITAMFYIKSVRHSRRGR